MVYIRRHPRLHLAIHLRIPTNIITERKVYYNVKYHEETDCCRLRQFRSAAESTAPTVTTSTAHTSAAIQTGTAKSAANPSADPVQSREPEPSAPDPAPDPTDAPDPASEDGIIRFPRVGLN